MKEQVWFDSEEDFLRKIEKQANMYHKHYMKEYTYYNSLSARFNIPILIVSAMNALTAISLSSFVRQELVSILNAVLSAGTGVLGSIQLYMKLNEKMSNAIRASTLMKKLALKISKELTVARDIRVSEGMTFLQESFAEFNTVLEAGNPIEIKMSNHLELESLQSVILDGSRQKASRLQDILSKISLGSKDNLRIMNNSPDLELARTPPGSGSSSPLEDL